ncbi:MAG: hypothetical protein KDE59_29660 [Anaerolineales bacterium]|nr:hypothetical protein [Anaerolineales bacterium]
MNSYLSKKQLYGLLDHSGEFCVSLFLPTHQEQLEAQMGDKLQLRNLLDQARSQLKWFAPALRHPDIERLLLPASDLLEQNGDFWKHQNQGLAIYLGVDFNQVVQLPMAIEPMVIVGRDFYLRPLLPLLQPEARFYLLLLSQNLVRLFKVTARELTEYHLREMPTSLAEARQYDDPQKEVQYHGASGSSSPGGRRAAIFHGHGNASTHKKEMLTQFCREVDEGLQRYLARESLPMVVASVNYLFDIYRSVNSYAHLLPTAISGNPERVGLKKLREAGAALVQPLLDKEVEATVEKLWQALPASRATADPARIITSAAHNRVDTLLINTPNEYWGLFDLETQKYEQHERRAPGSQEMLNLAALQTLRHDGTVMVLEPGILAEEIKTAALFRY